MKSQRPKKNSNARTLTDQRRRITALRRECLRLGHELGKSLNDLEAVRHNLDALFSSVTWRFAALLNRLISTLMPNRRESTAWDQLRRIIHANNMSEPSNEDDFHWYCPESTTAVGLYRNDNGKPLMIGLWGTPHEQIPPLPDNIIELVVVRDEDEFLTTNSINVILLFAHDQETLQNKLAVCEFYRMPTAAVVDSTLTGSDSWTVECTAIGLQGDDQTTFPMTITFRLSGRLEWRQFLISAGMMANQWRRAVPFLEQRYLIQNPDVAKAVRNKVFPTGSEHWKIIGREEFIRGNRRYNPRHTSPDLGTRKVSPSLRRNFEHELRSWAAPPTISVVVPIHKVAVKWLKAAVKSVQQQIYPRWELCLVDDHSGSAEIATFLSSFNDERIKVKVLTENVGIAQATNVGVSMATGEYIALLDHDDELTLDALWLVARVIVEHTPDLIYSDEAKLNASDQVVEPHFKPDFAPEMIQSQNYISHLGVYRKSILDEIGGFRPGYDGSQDHDMVLRFIAHATSVFHIPRILYYWRKVPGSTATLFSHKNYAWDAGVHALLSLYSDRNDGTRVEKGRFPGTYRVRYPIKGRPKISILIPFRDQPKLLDQCLSSILEKTEYENFEVLGVDNASELSSTTEAIVHWSKMDQRIRFVAYPHNFNYAAINNFAVQQVDGTHVLLLNNDIKVIDSSWLTALLEFSQQPAIGAVGGKLLYPDDTIQHAGVIVGIGGVAGHSHKYFNDKVPGYFSRPHIIQNVSAVTGACLMVKRSLYLETGGLDGQHLQVAFNDVDFCLRLRELGFRNVYTPYCTLYHYESRSRGQEDTLEKQQRFAAEACYMRRRHVQCLALGDPYYNPNLTLEHENFAIREQWSHG